MIHATVTSVKGSTNDLKGEAQTGTGEKVTFTNNGYRVPERSPRGPYLPLRLNRSMHRKPVIGDKIIFVRGDNGNAARWTLTVRWRKLCDEHNDRLLKGR